MIDYENEMNRLREVAGTAPVGESNPRARALEERYIVLLREAGCVCDLPLIGLFHDGRAKCRLCNTVAAAEDIV